MPDKIDRMRKAQKDRQFDEKLKQAVLTAADGDLVKVPFEQRPPQKPIGRPPDAPSLPPKPPKPAAELLIFSCGHSKPIAHFKGIACPECRDKARKEKAARKREKREATQQARYVEEVRRWPANSMLKKHWTGESWLCHALVLEAPDIFQATDSSSMRAEQLCFAQYKEWLKAKEQA